MYYGIIFLKGGDLLEFVHLHLHTDRSKMDGLSKPEDIVKKVYELKQPGFAITDHGTTYGLMAGYNAINEFNKDRKKDGLEPYPMKIVFGCEFYFAPNISIKDKSMYHLIILAKNNQGFYNLNKLMSIASLEENFYYKPRIDFNMLEQYNEGLIVTTACMGGILSISHQEEDMEVDDSEYWVKKFKSLFGSDFYIELHTNKLEGQTEFNQKAEALASRHNIQVVAACDSHYVNKEQAEVHRKWKNLGDENKYYSTDDFYIMSKLEVIHALKYHKLSPDIIQQSIDNTYFIWEQCNVEIELGKQHYPDYPVKDKLEYIKEICREGWRKKIFPVLHKNPELKNIYTQRFLYELDVLTKANYLNYFLITWDILNFCSKKNIYTGVGRGSVTASLVAYLMNITKIDPIKYGLVFERFAHLERVTPADIDTDVPQSRRQEVIEYIQEKYGTVYQVKTPNFMGDKGALKRAGETLGYEPALIKELSKKIIIGLDDIKDHKQLVNLAKEFLGVMQYTSVHASAVVVFPEDPYGFCAIERQGDTLAAACDFHDLESRGILKQDVLGLKTCDVIANTMKDINGLDIDNLPLDDKLTFEMLCKGNTSGCFQIESYGMTQLVKDIQPECFKDMIPLVALYRPGPKDAGMIDIFVAGRNGNDITYLHPKLESILSPTYGIILYQEQILQIAKDLCGYTLGQADMLRRGIGRKEKEIVQSFRNDFISKGVANGIEKKIISEIWSQIETFANYGFNQGHSTAYGYISYQTAYLKAHYPLQFMCALINSEKKQEDIVPYIKECSNINIEILPPNIVKSSNIWTIEDSCLRIGLGYIKNVGNIEFVPNNNFVKFMYANKLNKRTVEFMVKAGCFPGDRGLQMEQLQWFKDDKHGYLRKLECISRINELKSQNKSTKQWEQKLQEIHPMPIKCETTYDEVLGEIEALGIVSGDILSRYNLSYVDEYNKELTMAQSIGGICVAFKPWNTKKGKPMAFITIKTTNGEFDFVYFGKDIMNENMVYLIAIRDKNIISVFEEATKII